jgi:TetR/AcrR family transcriptional regulator, transcriptional repressor for nem operon
MPWEKEFDVQQTLQRAMQVFWSRGYEATSVQDLLDHMGIHRGSLYATFGDKRALFLAALRLYDSDCRKAQLEAIERVHVGKAAIQALFDGWVDTLVHDRARSGCFLTNTALEMAAHDSEVAALVAASQSDIESFFQRLVRRAQSLGEIAPQRDPVVLARGLLATLVGLLVLGRSRPEPALLRSIVQGAMASLS